MKPRLRAVVEEPPRISVGAAAVLSRRHAEMAAMLEEVTTRVNVLFDSTSRAPELLLERDGEGPRPASVGALVELTAELQTIIDKYKAKATELLAATVPLPDGVSVAAGDASEEVRLDRVVRREQKAKPAPAKEAVAPG